MILNDSTVKHYYLGFGKNHNYVEGKSNNVKGHVTNKDRLELKFTNSHGKSTVALGKAWVFGPLVIVNATAYGYTKWPDGIKILNIGIRTTKSIRFIMPIAINQILSVKIRWR